MCRIVYELFLDSTEAELNDSEVHSCTRIIVLDVTVGLFVQFLSFCVCYDGWLCCLLFDCSRRSLSLLHQSDLFFVLFIQRSTFVVSAWSFGFSSPPQRPMPSDFEGFSIQDCIHYIYFHILILEKEPVFSLFKVQC